MENQHYSERSKCLICDSDDLSTLFDKDYSVALGCYSVENTEKSLFMPYNILKCNSCLTFQTKYLGDVNVIYDYSAGAYGSIRGSMNDLFSDFILQNNDIKGVVEVGAGNGNLADIILNKNELSYSIIDPTYSGTINNRIIQREFIENIDEIKTEANTLVMSHVFEHFYNPSLVLQKIEKCKNIEYIYLSFPDLEYCIKHDSYHVLNPEHIYYIENQFINAYFEKYGFKSLRTYHHKNHSVFFEFKRNTSDASESIKLQNKSSLNDVTEFFNRVEMRISYIHNEIDKLPSRCKVYIWPCAMFTTFIFALGLNINRISGILDNSPLKIGKYLYGYNIKCISFDEILQKTEHCAIILNGGCYNQEIDTSKYPHITFI